jgi:hypothetical protein
MLALAREGNEILCRSHAYNYYPYKNITRLPQSFDAYPS